MNRLKQITAKAKTLYKTGKYKKWTDAIKQASKSLSGSGTGTHKDTKSHNVNVRVVSGTKKKRIGAVKIIQKGESKNAKVHKVLQQVRTKKGQFKGYRSISGLSKKQELIRLKQLAGRSGSPLVKRVATIIASKVVNGGYDSVESVFNDIMRGGMQSGIISQLIYYKDTLAWYKKYRKEIMVLLTDAMSDYGSYNPSDLFGRNWDVEDPLAHDTTNQNLLAWFSFEKITSDLANELGYDI